MEATQRVRGGLGRFAGTRRGSATIAVAAAALAGIVLLTFVSGYKRQLQGGTAERSALVANRLIPKGTSGAVVVSDGLSKPTMVQSGSLEAGALANAAAVGDKVATRDIYPGEQITAADFASNADPLRGKLTGDQRAISVPLDSAHGQIGEIRAGDTVDVLAGFNSANATTGRGRPELRTLIQGVLVLKAPDAGADVKGNDTKDLTVRVTSDEAARLAFAADNGKVWFVLRPPSGASDGRPASVTLDSLLAGTPAIEVGR
jgi:Flp pilus assembly protein CpaB